MALRARVSGIFTVEQKRIGRAGAMKRGSGRVAHLAWQVRIDKNSLSQKRTVTNSIY
jgi:hypothetical protein